MPDVNKISGESRDELPMAESGGDVQKPRPSLKIRIRRPPKAPMNGDSLSDSAPASAVRPPPPAATPMETTEESATATFDISASAPAPAVRFAPAKRGRRSEAGTSSTAPAATSVNPSSAKHFRPNEVFAACPPSHSSPVASLPAKAKKVGRPKKAKQVKTSITFRSGPLADADGECMQARSQAYWREAQWGPGQDVEECDGSAPASTVTPADSQPAAAPPRDTPATGNKRVRPIKRTTVDRGLDTERELSSSADQEMPSSSTAAGKVVAFWKIKQSEATKPSKVARRGGRKARGPLAV
ncbi:hypothetical protein PtB15_12B449 [Puccinia triticina]|nr:hypothetical protein PtB15_12B449 [Puccinia triticina]